MAALAELALSREPEAARAGTDAIFRQVVEPMGDAFEPRLCDLYIRFFATLVGHARRKANWLDRRLAEIGLGSEHDLVRRAERVRIVRPARMGRVRKILVLSRVTLGADVAVTSVLLRKLLCRFPGAEVKLLGSAKAALLFAGDARVGSREVNYPRGGGLLDRLAAWDRVVDAVRDETAGLQAGEYLVVDPDSRLTQLGMLPVTEDDAGYCFFESRSFARPGCETLAELAAAWASEAFGGDAGEVHPWVSLPTALRAGGRWASVNLGGGDNPGKRIGGDFEERLLRGLRAAGWNIFLDTGDGGEETQRVEALLERLADSGIEPWRGSLAGFGARIAASGLYIGYDSACQHLAAALAVPLVDIFTGYSSERMAVRWRPAGAGRVTMVVLDPHAVEPEAVLARVLEAAR